MMTAQYDKDVILNQMKPTDTGVHIQFMELVF